MKLVAVTQNLQLMSQINGNPPSLDPGDSQYGAYTQFLRANALVIIIAIGLAYYIWNKWRASLCQEGSAVNNTGLYENNNAKLLAEHENMLAQRSQLQASYTINSAEHSIIQMQRDEERKREKLEDRGKTKSQKLQYKTKVDYFPLSGGQGSSFKPTKKTPISGEG